MENITVHDYFTILRRRRKILAITTAVMVILTGYFAITFSRYRSEATIQVQAPDIPQGMTMPAGVQASTFIEAMADQQIEQIQEKITSSASLIEIITKFDLYADARKTTPMTDIVASMQKKIKIELVSADLANPSASKQATPGQMSAIAFTMSFTYPDPLSAQHVTNELVTRFLDEDLRQRRTKAKETSDFLGTQIDALEKSMADQEQKIAAFKAQHSDARPESLLLNQQEASMTAASLEQIQAQLGGLERTRGDLRAQLASVEPYSRVVADGQVLTTPAIQLKALQAKFSTMSAQYGPDHPDVVRVRHQIEALQAEVGATEDSADVQSMLNDARTNLAAAIKTYGPEHPDVQALRRQVTGLESKLAVVARNPTLHTDIKKDADNPAYLMLVAQMNAADQQYQSLLIQKAALEKQRESYTQAVARMPAVEQQLSALARDYDNAQLRYRELKEKKLSADMTEQMEQGRINTRMQVIEPPELPTHTSPSRSIVILAALVFSVLCGIGSVAVAEQLSQNVHGVSHLSSLTGEMALVAVPHLFTLEEVATTRRRRNRNALISLGALIVGLILFDRAVMPFDVLWGIISARLGIS